MLKVGTLVEWRGSVGLVIGPCTKRWAVPHVAETLGGG